jgi:oxalate decarboxylase/phosphoglucose isomerase-like protein (cupin superfamily)
MKIIHYTEVRGKSYAASGPQGLLARVVIGKDDGAGEIYGNSGWTKIPTGSVVFIPGHEEHQMRNPGEEPLVIVCLVPTGAPEF